MNRSRFLALLLVVAAGCQRSSTSPEAGQLVATWDGVERGAGRLRANATWCATDSILEFLAREGERGVGVALRLASGNPVAGRFDFVHPAQETVSRPAATGAWRFMTTDALHAFVTRSGDLELTEVADGRMSGRLTLRLVAQSGPDTILVQGSFLRVPIDSAPSPCGTAPRTPVEVF